MDIEEAVRDLKYSTYSCLPFGSVMANKEAIETVLSELETYKTKYENLKLRNKGTKEALRVSEDLEKHFSEEASILEAELEKKDRLIDLIVNRFQQICVTPSLAKYQWKRICSKDLKICEGKLCEDCIKEYFTNKVESEGK